MLRALLRLTVLTAAIATAPVLWGQTVDMTNGDVVNLVKAQLSDQIVMTAVSEAKSTVFDVSPTGLIALKQAGVSDAVIAAMQKRAAADRQAAPARSGPASPAPSANAAGGAQAASGVVRGRVMLRGTPPTPASINMAADPACVKVAGTEVTQANVLVDPSGGLQNVFVFISDGLPAGATFPLPTVPARLDQRACQFMPRVLGVRVGQPLQIVNSDPTLQDIHALPKLNAAFNTAQPLQGMTTTHTFENVEVMVPVADDVHPWKSAFIAVLPHPFFAVTAGDGSFTITGVPPGTYVLTAWHEQFGALMQRITIAQGPAGDTTFEFSAPPAAAAEAAPTVPASPSSDPVRVGGEIPPPPKLKDVSPVYPQIAISARVQGAVFIQATIGVTGKVERADVVQSIPLLDQAALDAVRQWEYAPTIRNGVAVPVTMTVMVTFSLK